MSIPLPLSGANIPSQRLRCLNPRYQYRGVQLTLAIAEEFLTDVDRVIAKAEQQA